MHRSRASQKKLMKIVDALFIVATILFLIIAFPVMVYVMTVGG